MQFEVGRTSQTAQSITGLLEKLLIVAVIVVGAHLVFNGRITIGALVAFHTISTAG